MSQPEDQSFIARVLSGDKDAFGALTARHRHAIYSFAFRMLGDREQAFDASQEVFIRAYARLETFDPSRRFRPWLFAIAANTCTDVLRRRRECDVSWDESSASNAPAADAVSPFEAVAKLDLQRIVAAALQGLSEAERTAVILKHIQGFTYEEISEMTNMPVGTVKSHTYRGRRKLAELLPGLGMEDTR